MRDLCLSEGCEGFLLCSHLEFYSSRFYVWVRDHLRIFANRVRSGLRSSLSRVAVQFCAIVAELALSALGCWAPWVGVRFWAVCPLPLWGVAAPGSRCLVCRSFLVAAEIRQRCGGLSVSWDCFVLWGAA